MKARSTKVRHCEHCGCKIGPPSGQRRKYAHYGSLEACGRIKRANEVLRLYRLKFAVSDMIGWDAGAHLAAKDALLVRGEPGVEFREACDLARKIVR